VTQPATPASLLEDLRHFSSPSVCQTFQLLPLPKTSQSTLQKLLNPISPFRILSPVATFLPPLTDCRFLLSLMCQPNFHPSTKPKLSIHNLPCGPKSSPLLACHVASNFIYYFNSLISFFFKKKTINL